MTPARIRSYENGSILILALWALSFLAIFVFLVGMRVRGKIQVLSRLNKTDQLGWLAESGVRKAKAVFDSSRSVKDFPLFGQQKEVLSNNPYQFRGMALGNGFFQVSYDSYTDFPKSSPIGYGLTDEESRIPINKVDRSTLKRLLAYAASLDEEQADDIAKAIIDWRVFGESDIVGFFSDAYYENLEFPYEPKKKDFENLDELMLIKGMTPSLYAKIRNFVTVYGTGKVNINTACRPVLVALGITLPLVDKILTVRRGPDGLENTSDDYIFSLSEARTFVVPSSLNLRPEELQEIDTLYVHGFIGVSSSCFRIESRGFFEGAQETRLITCVFEGNSGKIFYWREEKRS